MDRFGLYVEAKGEEDLYKRSEIIRRRIEFERDPEFSVPITKMTMLLSFDKYEQHVELLRMLK